MIGLVGETIPASRRFGVAPDLIRGLEFLWLEVTNRCNLHCSHCYSDSGPHEPETFGLQLSDWMQLLEEARALGCRKVQFIGGEPLLYNGLSCLLREARRLDYDIIEVFTNGTRFTDSMANLFKENGISLATSFYSNDSCTHDRVTGVQGSQKKTVEALKRAINVGVSTRVGVITMEEEALSVANETIEFLQKLGVVNVGIDHVRGIGRGKGADANLNPKHELCGGCWRGSLAVNSAGDVSPCVFSHFHPVGHISDGLVEILNNQNLRNFRQNMMKSEMASADCVPYYCSPKYWCEPGKV